MFQPPPRTATQASRWQAGDPVERLLDDVSDIWVGAVVLAVRGPELYDIQFADDGSLERNVEGSELRVRSLRLELPEEVWARAGAYLCSPYELCTFECIGRGPRAVARRDAQAWWCAAFHNRFGRCSTDCEFVRLHDAAAAARAAVARCSAASLPDRSSLVPVPWKERYASRHRSEAANVLEAHLTAMMCRVER
eukprot:gnl/TRDRNA2_/TRDRNA2_162045_c0_seq5.p1 gnl/TRDRNA2_/TRDRNA2_162045_c0~~gnl/TRDRNA2_/TRDRNA2_162045_c0_seq5.p1  ORF type:complete len:194 (+),score=22.24 gnl/TRDRNA2_/TRDRNA2_162045_c0_seq5:43-624(+)